jgi:ADP-heptose:LPS heptosyltransferase
LYFISDNCKNPYNFVKKNILKKILIIRFSSIGDIVLTSPIVRCVKQQIPNCELHFAVKKTYSSIVLSNPYIDKIHLLDNNDNELIKQLKKENFDIIIDLHNNLRTAKIKWILRCKSFSFPKLNIKKYLLTHLKFNLLPQKHVVDRYFLAVKKLGVKNDFLGCDFFISNDAFLTPEISDYISTKSPIALAVGGNHHTKQIPIEKIKELLEQNNHHFILLGGKEDIEKSEIIHRNFPNKTLNVCGKISLEQSALVMKNCGAVVTPDTGLMHIASALDIQVVSVWGNTVPDFGMYPYMPQHPEKFKMLEVKNLKCRPCSKIGYKKCPKQHFDCMMKQDFKDVFKSV